jgi:integrase
MAKQRMARLTQDDVKRAKPGEKLNDGRGLILQCTGSNAKSWIYRYVIAGRERALGLGSAYDISLDEARDAAAKARGLKAKGVDPIEWRNAEREAAKAVARKTITFEKAAERYFNDHADDWKNAKHKFEWESSLRRYAHPIIGAMNVRDIDTTAVLQVLEQHVAVIDARGRKVKDTDGKTKTRKLWLARRETSRRLRQRIEVILDACRARGEREGDNPAKWEGHLKSVLAGAANGKRVVKHLAAMPHSELGGLLQNLLQRKSTSAKCLAFAFYTAARPNEALGARWSEVSIPEKLWSIPPGRMKGTREHKVPLSTGALAILKTLAPRSDELVFANVDGTPLSEAALRKTMAKCGAAEYTVHGSVRGGLKTWATECTDTPRAIVELALAHKGDDLEEAYQRGDAIDRRRVLMQNWCDYLGGKTASILPMHPRAERRAHR